jgi:drug/metabolite transporter (DMT)-like permease
MPSSHRNNPLQGLLKDDSARGIAAITGAAVLYSFFGVLIRVQASSFSNSGQVLVRTAFALIVMLLVIGVKRNWRLPKSERWLVAVFGVIGTLYPLAITISTNHIKASNAIVLLYAGGILSSLVLGWGIFRERLTPLKVASSLLALAGLFVFAYPFSFAGTALFGIVMGLGSGVFDAICNTIRKYLRHTPREVLMASSFLITVALLAVSPQPVMTHTLTLPAAVTAIVHGFCIIATGTLLIYGFRHTEVHIGTIILASEIFISLVVNYFLLQESPTAQELLGALIIFSASVLIAANDIRTRRKEPLIIGDLE